MNAASPGLFSTMQSWRQLKLGQLAAHVRIATQSVEASHAVDWFWQEPLLSFSTQAAQSEVAG
jgi:hypothetical protein